VAAILLTEMPALAAPEAPAAGPPPPRSSESGGAQPRELARVRYRQGAEAYAEGRYRDAIDLFLEADQLAPSAALSFNIALAYAKIDDTASALRWYRDYLRRDPGAPDRPRVEDVIHGLEARLAKSGVQQITVMSTPPAASIMVDGKPFGLTPSTFEIAPGSHRVEVRLPAYTPATRVVDLSADHALDVQFDLERAPAAPEPALPPLPPASPAPAPPAPRTEPAPPQAEVQHPKESAPPSATHPSSTHATLRTLGWIGIGVGGAALGTSLIFELLRRESESDAKSAKTQVGFNQAIQTMEDRQTAARVFLGLGAAFAVGGGVLLFLGRDPKHSKETAFSVGCFAGGCGGLVRGKF
jgi:tetratricopeptide (TPR) repeat protein